MRYFLILVFCTIFASEACADEDKPQIEVLAIEYPPFTSQGLNDLGVSFNKLNKLIGAEFSIEPVFLPPSRAQFTLNNDQWCLSFYPRSNDESDSVQFRLFEDEMKLTLIHAKQDTPLQWRSLSDLAGQSLAVLRVQAQNPFLKQFSQAGIKLVYVESVEITLQMVLKSRTDFALGDNISLKYFQEHNPIYESLAMSDTSIKTTRLMIEANPNCQHFSDVKRLIAPN